MTLEEKQAVHVEGHEVRVKPIPESGCVWAPQAWRGGRIQVIVPLDGYQQARESGHVIVQAEDCLSRVSRPPEAGERGPQVRVGEEHAGRDAVRGHGSVGGGEGRGFKAVSNREGCEGVSMTNQAFDRAVSTIVGVLVLVAITASLAPVAFLAAEDQPGVSPTAELEWNGYQPDGTGPVELYRMEVHRIHGAETPVNASIWTNGTRLSVELARGSVVFVSCSESEATVSLAGRTMGWSRLEACGTPTDSAPGEGKNTSGAEGLENRSRPEGCMYLEEENTERSGAVAEVVVCEPEEVSGLRG